MDIRDLYQAALEQTPQMIRILNQNGEIIFENRPFEASSKVFVSSDLSGQVVSVDGHFFILMKQMIQCHGEDFLLEIYTNASPLQCQVAELTEKLLIDHRTGISSAMAIKEQMDEMVEKKREFVVIMCDVDDFKNINDTYGHVVGDKVLLFVAQTLKKAFRENDPIGRYGGDEFILAIPTDTNFQLLDVANRINRICQDLQKPSLIDHKRIDVHISFGLAQYDFALDTFQNKDRADKALYYQKRKRKGGYTIYPGDIPVTKQ